MSGIPAISAVGDDTYSTSGTAGDDLIPPPVPPSSSRFVTRNSENSSSQSNHDPSIPEAYHFEGTPNYGVWSFRIQHALSSCGLFDYCITPPSVPTSHHERVARSIVMGILINNAKNSGMKILKRYNEPHACWSYLKRRYESQSGPRKAYLVDKFFVLRKTETTTMDVHLTEVRNIADLLEEVNVVLPDEVIVYYALKNLPRDYDIVRRMLMGNSVLPSFEEMESILLSEEITIGLVSEEKSGEALVVQRDRTRRVPSRQSVGNNSNFQGYANTGFRRQIPVRNYSNSFPSNGLAPSSGSGNSPAGTSYQPRFRQRGPTRPRPHIVCDFCLGEGHLDRECDIKALIDQMRDMDHRLEQRRKQRPGGQVHSLEENEDDETNVADEEYVTLDDPNDVEAYTVELDSLTGSSSRPSTCIPCTAVYPSEHCNSSKPIDSDSSVLAVSLNLVHETPPTVSHWHLDSGATHHITGNQSMFTALQHRKCNGVKSAGGHGHDVLGVGSVNLQLPNGHIQTVPQVLYSPTIRKNLLSVGLIADENHSLEFLSEGCFIRNRFTREFIAYAPREDRQGLYKLEGDTITNAEVNTVTIDKSSASELWHRRLSHFNNDGLRRMMTSGAVKGLPVLTVPDTPCVSCYRGKQARTKIPKRSTNRATVPLELIHSDICGPFRTPSLGGARYFITFVDDYSRFLWVYFLLK